MAAKVFYTVFFLCLISVATSIPNIAQDNSKTQCKGLQTNERISALGLELGMCIDDVISEYSKHNTNSLGENKSSLPNIKLYTVGYIGKPPPEKEDLFSSNVLLTFYHDTLIKFSGIFYYKNSTSNKWAFETLNDVLSNKYGAGEYDKSYQLSGKTYQYSKFWVSRGTQIHLEIKPKYPQALNIVYVNIDKYQKILEEEEKSQLEKYGEGF